VFDKQTQFLKEKQVFLRLDMARKKEQHGKHLDDVSQNHSLPVAVLEESIFHKKQF